MKKVAFVTGATSGFGEAITRRLVEEGYQVIACGRRSERLYALAESLPEGTLWPIPLDICDQTAIRQAVENLPKNFSPIDVLVNNAGLALGLESSHEANLDEWEKMIDTNIKGLLFITRIILPKMVKRDSGHIVNLGSVAASWPYPGGNCYGGTKAFVQQFSRNLRADLQGTHVRVTNIEPGMAETEFSLIRFKGDQEKANAVYNGTQPLEAEDIAETVHWVTQLPAHMNVNNIELMPTCQSWGPLTVSRETKS